MNRIHKVTVRSNDNDKDDDKDNGNGNTNTNTNTNTNVTAGEKIGRGDPTTGNDDADRASAPRTIPGNRNSVGLQHQKEEQQQKQQQQKQQKPHRRHKRGWWKRKRKWSSSSSSCLLYPLVFGFGALYVFHLYKIVVILARHHHSHRQENPGIPKTVPGSLLRKNHAIATGKKKNTAEDSANDAVSHREVVVAAPTPPQNKANSEATTEMDHKHGHEQEHGHEHEHEHDHPIGNCAINLFGLPRSFGHHVLPSLVTNVLKPNRRYRCDWFVHFFNVTIEETDTEITAAEAKAKASALLSRGGNKGGTVAPQDVYLLRDAVRKEYEGESEGEIDENGRSTSTSSWSSSSLFGGPPTVHFVADTDRDFAAQRREWIDEIVWRNASSTSTSKSNSNSNSNSNNNNQRRDGVAYERMLYAGTVTALHNNGMYDDADEMFMTGIQKGFLPFNFVREKQQFTLDLHGLNVALAHSAVRIAMRQQAATVAEEARTASSDSTSTSDSTNNNNNNNNNMMIITGKGRHSELYLRPVLRPEVQRMLLEEFYPPLNTMSVPGNIGALTILAHDIEAWQEHQQQQKGVRMLKLASVLRNLSSQERLKRIIALKMEAASANDSGTSGTDVDAEDGSD